MDRFKASHILMGQPPLCVPGGRKRSRVASIENDNEMAAYRIKFECQHLGRYMATTKRRIIWGFGFLSTTPGGGERVEKEYEIELIWSLRSGKTKLYWNKSDISYVHKGPSKNPNCLRFDWKVEGVKYGVSAYVNSGMVKNQYDFFIGGRSIFLLPSKSDFLNCRPNFDSRIVEALTGPSESDDNDSRPLVISGDSQSNEGDIEPGAVQQRLAAVGLMSNRFDMVDELQSGYSSMLDTMKNEVAAAVPETEDMMSRAIIHAYSEDHDSSDAGSLSSALSETGSIDPVDLEVETIGETFRWLKLSRDILPPADLRDHKLEFMQGHVETMVSHVRHERLAADIATRLMLQIATILGLKVSKELERNTIIFLNLNSFTTADDLMNVMYPFGEISWAVVSESYEGFGMCRFTSEPAVQRILEYDGVIAINGRSCEWYEMYSSPISQPPHYERNEDLHVAVPLHRNFIVSDDAIEATYQQSTYQTQKVRSMTMEQLRPPSFEQNGFDSSTSSQTFRRPSYNHASTGTVSTLSTVEFDDFDISVHAINQPQFY